MSLFPIPYQPVNFTGSRLIVDCCDTEPPLLIHPSDDTLIFQLRFEPCPAQEGEIGVDNFTGVNWDATGLGWTVLLGGGAQFSPGSEGASLTWNPVQFAPTPGTPYSVVIDVLNLQGELQVSLGGVTVTLTTGGEHTFIIIPLTSDPLTLTVPNDTSVGRVSTVQAYDVGTGIAMELVEGDTVLWSANIEDDGEYFNFSSGNLIVIVPMEDTGIEAGQCFQVRVPGQCYGEAALLSQTLQADTCRSTVKVRVCNSAPYFGFAPFRFEARVPAQMGRPSWSYEVEEERLTSGTLQRNNAKMIESFDLLIQPISQYLHPWVASWPLWEHIYINGAEYIVLAEDYTPTYGDDQFGTGGIALKVEAIMAALGRVTCADPGAGCPPHDDPICVVPEATVQIVGDTVSASILSDIGSTPGQILWSKSGVDQAPVNITTIPASYPLGTLLPGECAIVTITNEQDRECDYTFDPVQRACGEGPGFFSLSVPPGPDSYVDLLLTGSGADGFTAMNCDGPQYDNFFLLNLRGDVCIYSSDSDSVPEGGIVGIVSSGEGTGMGPVEFDVTGMTGLTSLQLGFTGGALIIGLDDLSSLQSLQWNNSAVTTIDLSGKPNLQEVVMTGNALDAAAVDHIIITVAANNIPGSIIDLSGGTNAAPTAASAAAAASIVSNGGSVTTN